MGRPAAVAVQLVDDRLVRVMRFEFSAGAVPMVFVEVEIKSQG